MSLPIVCRPALLGTIVLGSMLSGLMAAPLAHAAQSEASVAAIAASLTGVYENSAQVQSGHANGEKPPPQRVTITIEPTKQDNWQIWHVHMDVDPEIALEADSDTSLDAVWAMNVTRSAPKKMLQLVPYTLLPSVASSSVQASAFDPGQWLALEGCALGGTFTAARIDLDAPTTEMCAAAAMGLGGKRAFLPTAVEHEGNRLRMQLIYFGKPWRVDAERTS